MHSPFLTEIRAIQNPALGSVLIWKFTESYTKASTKSPPLFLTFLVLPLLFSQEFIKVISSTQNKSGWHKLVEKLADSSNAKADLLLSIQTRAIEMRPLTLASLQIGQECRLLTVRVDGTVLAGTISSDAPWPDSLRSMARAAERLGLWFSGMSIFELSTSLKVRF